MDKLLNWLFVLAFASLMVTHAHAQETEKKTRYMVWEVKLTSPDQLILTIEAIKAQNDLFREIKYPYANSTQYTSEGFLWYSVRFSDYADIDTIIAITEQLWKGNPELADTFQLKFEGAFSSVSRMVFEHHPELSFPSTMPPDITEGKQFRFFEICYVKEGKKEVFEELIKKYIKLRKRHRYKDAFYTMYPTFGSDMSVVYFIDEMGNNPTEHYSMNADAWNKFGKKGQLLWYEMTQVLDKVETHIGQVDWDLMYSPTALQDTIPN